MEIIGCLRTASLYGCNVKETELAISLLMCVPRPCTIRNRGQVTYRMALRRVWSTRALSYR